MISILLLEDELLLAEDLKAKLERLGYRIMGIAVSGEEAITQVNRQIPDLAILDINVKGEMNGLEVGSYFRKSFNIPIIYLTQYTDLQTFEKAKVINPSSYLIKPVNLWDLVRAIELAISQHALAQSQETDTYLLPKAFFLKSTDQNFEKVSLDEIYYLQAAGAYTEIQTAKKKYVFSDNLRHFEKKLIAPQLLRVHRSWIVNTDRVEKIAESNLYIDGVQIPIGKTYKSTIKERFKTI